MAAALIILGLAVLLVARHGCATPPLVEPVYLVRPRARRGSGCLLITMFFLGILFALLVLAPLSTR
jgi:hypothetical protein